MLSFFLVVVLAAVFYALIPGIGAFYVRSRWREFRRRLLSTSLYPIVQYRDLRLAKDGVVGNFRFFGGLEAIQGEGSVWLRSGNLSVAAELNKVPVYWLPSSSFREAEGRIEINEESLPDETPSQVPWNRIFSLPEGTQIFLSGELHADKGRGTFRSAKENPLTVVIYDGQPSSILRRSIWSGRHRNEYINPFMPGSVTAGSFSLLILAYVLLRFPILRLQALASLTMSLFPLLVFVPPGVLFVVLYRRWWKEARFLRAERDMLLLPIRYFKSFRGESERETTALPNDEEYVVERFYNEGEARKRLGTGRVRTATRLRRAAADSYYVFGKRDGDNQALAAPSDPMAELIMVPGNPLQLSGLCGRRARRFELLSTAAVVAGMLMNLVGALVVLAALIR